MDFSKYSTPSASAQSMDRAMRFSPLALATALLASFVIAGPIGAVQTPHNWEEYSALCSSSGGVPHQADSNGPLRCTGPSTPTQQQEPAKLDPRMFWIGAAATVSGDVTFIYPSGQRVSGADAARAPIPLGARVVTGPSGHVKILLVDQTSFTISGPGEMVMDRFVYDPETDATPTRISVKIVKGLFRWVTGKVAQRDPSSIQVGTPVGNLEVRATDSEHLNGFIERFALSPFSVL